MWCECIQSTLQNKCYLNKATKLFENEEKTIKGTTLDDKEKPRKTNKIKIKEQAKKTNPVKDKKNVNRFLILHTSR